MHPDSTGTAQQPAPTTRYAVAIFVAFAAGHFLSYALRTVNAALAPYLTQDLGLSPTDLGWLSAAYFVSFAALQYPLGIWLDRYGERRVETLLLIIAAFGTLLFAVGGSIATLSWGRILVGVGVSACLMAPFTYFRRNFPPHRQSQLSLWMMVAGTIGAVSATLPAAALAEFAGWRSVFFLFAALLLASAVAIYLFVPPHPPTTPATGAASADAADNRGLLRHPAVIQIMPVVMMGQGGLIALQTLWAGPWMTEVLGMSSTRTAGNLFAFMLMITVAYIAMSFVGPTLQRRGIRLQRIAFCGHIAAVSLIFAITLLPYPWAWLLWLVLACCFPANVLLQPGFSLYFPRSMAGRALTLYNLFTFVGAFIVQLGIGVLIDLLHNLGVSYHYAYQGSFLIYGALYLASVIWFYQRGGHR